MGGGGALHSSSKGGFTHVGIAPEGAVQVDKPLGLGGGVGVGVETGVVGVVGVLEGLEILSETAWTPFLDITPPMPPTMSKTMSLSILR